MPLTRDSVLRLMAGRSTPICPTCASTVLGLEFARVYDAVQDLDVRGDHRFRIGSCGDCGKRERVVWP